MANVARITIFTNAGIRIEFVKEYSETEQELADEILNTEEKFLQIEGGKVHTIVSKSDSLHLKKSEIAVISIVKISK